MTDLSPISPEHQHLDVGRDTFALSASGVPLRFTPLEKKFLIALDKHHNLALATQEIGKDVEWGAMFFRKPKIYEWMTKIAAESAAKSGMTVQWCFATALDIIRGKQIWWEGECETCHVKQKSWLEPDDDKGVLSAPCLACHAPVLMNEIVKPVKVDRQQMVAFQEVMSRIVPKIERVQHEFSEETFEFHAREA